MAKPYPQLILFGDSLFQQSTWLQDGFAFQAALQDRVIRKLDVVNRGFSGWNTANAVKYLPEIFPEPQSGSPKIDYFFVLLGANDAVRSLPTTSQHVPIEEYKANLGKIINHANVRAHKPKIVIVAPPPVDEIKLIKLDTADGHSTSTRTSAITAAYAENAREVARENDVELLDLWQAINDKAVEMAPGDYKEGGPLLGTPANGKQGGLDSLLPDGLHMSGDAYKVFLDLVLAYVGKELDSADHDSYVFPDWRLLNPPKI